MNPSQLVQIVDSGVWRVTSAQRCLQNCVVCEGYSEKSALLLEIGLSFSKHKCELKSMLLDCIKDWTAVR